MYKRELEERAARIVHQAVIEHYRRLSDYIQDRLLSGRKLDSKWIATLTNELARLNDRYSSEMVNEIRDMIIQAARTAGLEMKGQAEEDGLSTEMIRLSPDQINIALLNTKIKIKKILDGSIPIASEIFTNALLTGKTNKEIADQVKTRIKLEYGKISQARADLIVRSELMSIYRQTMEKVGEELGYEFYKYIGPNDVRTEPICQRYLNKIKTREEWLKLEPLIFQYGLHYGCRHQLVPVFTNK